MSKYICVFCDERKESDTAHLINGKIGICRHCFKNLDKTAYASPYQGTEHIAFTMSPFEYTKSMRKVILDLKFSNCKAYAKLLADTMKDYLDSYDIWDTFDYIVPVPLHKKRLKERGYNQSELIAKEVAEYLKILCVQICLSAQKQLKSKVHLYERNVLQMFRVHSNAQKNVTVRKYCFLTISTPQETPLSLVQENWRITVLNKYVL